MTTPWKRLYFHHLKKAGGTSLNQWLDSQFPAYPDNFREIQRYAFSQFGEEPNQHLAERKRLRDFTEAIFAQRAVLHDHAGVAPYVPENTLCFTVLRDPTRRLLSQVRDYRRLSQASIAHYPESIQTMFREIKELSLNDFLKRYARASAPHGLFFDNYMVRAIAQNRIGCLAQQEPDAGNLVAIAMDVLENDFHFVGLLEQEQRTNAFLCSTMGWPPVTVVPAMNATDKSMTPPAEVQEAADIIGQATQHDAIIYEFACTLNDSSFQAMAPYAAEAFEGAFLQARLAQFPNVSQDKAVRFEVALPIIGSGHSGRRTTADGTFVIENRPGTPLILYLPAPKNRRIKVFLDLLHNKYPAQHVRFMTINDTAVVPNFDKKNDVITCDFKTDRRGWIKLRLSSDGATPEQLQKPLKIQAYGWTVQKWFR